MPPNSATPKRPGSPYPSSEGGSDDWDGVIPHSQGSSFYRYGPVSTSINSGLYSVDSTASSVHSLLSSYAEGESVSTDVPLGDAGDHTLSGAKGSPDEEATHELDVTKSNQATGLASRLSLYLGRMIHPNGDGRRPYEAVEVEMQEEGKMSLAKEGTSGPEATGHVRTKARGGRSSMQAVVPETIAEDPLEDLYWPSVTGGFVTAPLPNHMLTHNAHANYCGQSAPSMHGAISNAGDPALTEDANATPQRRGWHYAMLVLAVLSYASIGPAYLFFPESNPFLLGQVVILLLFLTFLNRLRTATSEERAALLSMDTNKWIAGSGLILTGTGLGWCYGMINTSVAHACLLHECHPLLIVFAALCCSTTNRPRAAQVVAAMGGFLAVGFVILTSHGDEGEGSGARVTLRGDLAAFSSAVTYMFYLPVAAKLSTRLPATLWTCQGYTLYIIMVVILGCTFTDTAQSGIGVFFMWRQSWEIIGVSMATGTLVMAGSIILNTTVLWFSAPTVAVTLLCDPVAATFIAFAVGKGPLPGWNTIIGGSVVLLCIAVVVHNEKPRGHAATSGSECEGEDDWSNAGDDRGPNETDATPVFDDESIKQLDTTPWNRVGSWVEQSAQRYKAVSAEVV